MSMASLVQLCGTTLEEAAKTLAATADCMERDLEVSMKLTDKPTHDHKTHRIAPGSEPAASSSEHSGRAVSLEPELEELPIAITKRSDLGTWESESCTGHGVDLLEAYVDKLERQKGRLRAVGKLLKAASS
jgi:hypothetical protein